MTVSLVSDVPWYLAHPPEISVTHYCDKSIRVRQQLVFWFLHQNDINNRIWYVVIRYFFAVMIEYWADSGLRTLVMCYLRRTL